MVKPRIPAIAGDDLETALFEITEAMLSAGIPDALIDEHVNTVRGMLDLGELALREQTERARSDIRRTSRQIKELKAWTRTPRDGAESSTDQPEPPPHPLIPPSVSEPRLRVPKTPSVSSAGPSGRPSPVRRRLPATAMPRDVEITPAGRRLLAELRASDAP